MLLKKLFFTLQTQAFNGYLRFNTSSWKGGCTISFELQMPQTSLIPFPKALTKFYQGSKDYNLTTADIMLAAPRKFITLQKVTFSVRMQLLIICRGESFPVTARPMFKAGLSGWMSWQFLNALELFFPFVQFSFLFNLYFQIKRAQKLSICHWLTKTSVWVFDVTDRRDGFHNFQRYH